MAKKKSRKRIKFLRSHSYNSSASNLTSASQQLQSISGTLISISSASREEAVQPLAIGGAKDSHGPAVLPIDSAPQLYPADVRVFVGDPPLYIRSIPEWQARDHIRRGEATVLRTSAKLRGIRVSPKYIKRAGEQREHESRQGGRLATLEQVEGIPVVGPAIRLFYTGRAERQNGTAQKLSAKQKTAQEQKWKKAA